VGEKTKPKTQGRKSAEISSYAFFAADFRNSIFLKPLGYDLQCGPVISLEQLAHSRIIFF
jgi:hypothetical protein